MINETYKIVKYEKSYYESFRLLSKSFPQFQPVNYIYHNQKIFEYLYKGFGHKESSSLLLVDNKNNSVLGFRGIIPSLYQVPTNNNTYKIINGNGITGWILKEDNNLPKGIGLKINNMTQENISIIVATCFGDGISLEVHKMNKFNIINNLNRYVLPLDNRMYKNLLNNNFDSNLIDGWTEKINTLISSSYPISPFTPDSELLEKLWVKVSSYKKILGLFKSKDYWNWRYIKCPYHKYLFFGNIMETGIIVGRIEKIFKFKNNSTDTLDETYTMHNKKVFRIIEIIPAQEKAWNSEYDASFNKLLLSVLKWAYDKGCIAADYQISNLLFDSLIKKIGFKIQSENYLPNECSLAGLFQPYLQKVHPINVAWKIKNKEILDLVCEDPITYFVKSDVAGDYPKYWPKIL